MTTAWANSASRRLGYMLVGTSFALMLSACGSLGSLFGGKASSSGLIFPEQALHTRPAGYMAGGDVAERVAVNPFDPIALNNLAIAEASRGRYQEALMLLQRAVKLAPARPDIAANLQSLQRWLVLAEGQASIGLHPQPLALPYQDSLVPDVPQLWQPPPSVIAQPPSRTPMPAATQTSPNAVPVPISNDRFPSITANPVPNNKVAPAPPPPTKPR